MIEEEALQAVAAVAAEIEAEDEREVMGEDEILAVIAEEMESTDRSDKWVAKKRTAEDYYNGELPRAPDIKGRSGVVSTDVADSVEWIMPAVIEALSGKTVKFRPMSAQDEKQADLETEFTRFVFHEDNNGYQALYNATKDALMCGAGIMKVVYDDTPERIVENYNGLQEPQLQALLADPMVEVTQITRSQTDGTSATIARIIKQGRVCVDAVPPEEFRVCDDHRGGDLKDARFVAHSRRRTASELLAEGYDPDIIEAANDRYLERAVDQPFNYVDPTTDDSQKMLVVTEAYLRIDINQDGIAELCKVVCLGEDTVTDILEIEEVPEIPFVAVNAIPTPYSPFGVSIFDRVRQIQDLKTAILRSTMDSYYQSTNRMKVVQEGQVNLDDLLVTRPGGIIRAKGHNAVMEIGGTPIGGEAFQLLQFADEQKRSRTGVSADSAMHNQLVSNESAHAVERVMSASEMLVGLIVRNIAETGLRPVYRLIRDNLVRYHNGTVPFRFKGKWINVDPSQWGDRSRMIVTVGAGAGEEQQKVAALQQVFAVQKEMMATDPMQAMVTPKEMYAALKDMVDMSGLGDPEQYFLDPESPAGQQVAQQKAQQGQQEQQQMMQQQQQQLEMQQAALQAQMQVAQAEQTKAQATLQNGQLKEQINAMKAQHQLEVEQMKAQISAAKEAGQQRFNIQKLQTDTAIKLTELEMQAKRDLNKDVQDNKEALNESGPSKGSKKGAGGKSGASPSQ